MAHKIYIGPMRYLYSGLSGTLWLLCVTLCNLKSGDDQA